MNAAYSCERGWRITQMHPFFLAQKDYLCCLVGALDVANFSELRKAEVRRIALPRTRLNRDKKKEAATTPQPPSS
jgi:hypothetical protein